MIGGGINGRPTQNLNHKRMNSNGCLDWVAMATCIEQLKLLPLNSYGYLHSLLGDVAKFTLYFTKIWVN
jgi:hypothetical protein